MRTVVLIALVLAGAANAALPASAQRFQSTSQLVMVDVLVTDDRRAVTDLSLGDFEVLDNGVLQKVEQLYMEQLPVNVIMALDTSNSVDGERLTSLKRGAQAIVARLRPADRAAVISFSHRLDLRSALTTDRETLRTAVAALTANGSTSLRDAAYAALAVRAADATRTLLLVFSDGVDTASILEESRVVEIARRSDATIYGIAARDPLPPLPLSRLQQFPVTPSQRRETATDDEFLTKLARETGGRVLYTDRDRDIERTFTRVLEEFNSRYILGFAPSDTTQRGWHRLEVRLKTRRGTVLARRGYFAS